MTKARKIQHVFDKKFQKERWVTGQEQHRPVLNRSLGSLLAEFEGKLLEISHKQNWTDSTYRMYGIMMKIIQEFIAAKGYENKLLKHIRRSFFEELKTWLENRKRKSINSDNKDKMKTISGSTIAKIFQLLARFIDYLNDEDTYNAGLASLCPSLYALLFAYS